MCIRSFEQREVILVLVKLKILVDGCLGLVLFIAVSWWKRSSSHVILQVGMILDEE